LLLKDCLAGDPVLLQKLGMGLSHWELLWKHPLELRQQIPWEFGSSWRLQQLLKLWRVCEWMLPWRQHQLLWFPSMAQELDHQLLWFRWRLNPWMKDLQVQQQKRHGNEMWDLGMVEP
jgi:hypothetical protein